MPRSGTTLCEQIIASHSKVTGAGELQHLIRISELKGDPISGKINLTEEVIYSIGRQYLDALSSFNTPENIITDKWPLNFQYVGFILEAFPDAKIIHLKRDPRATCWSIYKSKWSGNGYGFSYNMDRNRWSQKQGR